MKTMLQRHSGAFSVALFSFLVLATITGLIIPAAIAASAFGAGSVGLTAMATIGDIRSDTTPTDHLKPDYSMLLTYHKPHRNPLDTLMRRMKLESPVKQFEIKWEEVDSHERQDAANGATGAGGAGASVALTVDNGNMWRVHDIISLPDAPGSKNLYITAIATNVLTVYQISTSGWGTVPAIADNARLTRLCNAKEEHGLASDARAVTPTLLSNKTQIYDEVITISGTRKATQNYTSTHDWERAKSQQLTDFRESISNSLIFGTLGETTLNSKPLRSAGGFDHYATANLITYTPGSLTEAIVMGWCKTVGIANSGSRNRWMFCGANLSAEMDQFPLTTLQRDNSEVKELGFNVTRIRSKFCVLNVVWDPALDRQFREDEARIMDMEHIRRRILRPMDKNDLDQKGNGVDGFGFQLIEESTAEFRYANTHAIVRPS